MTYEKRAIYWVLKEKYAGRLLTLPKDDAKRLSTGEPADYIIGWNSFLGCKIDLSYKPLIPRPETEFWVGEAIKDISGAHNKSLRCLDIFSGSGCMGIALLRHLPNVFIDFADSEENCLKQIALNCEINAVAKARFEVIQSDIFSNLNNQYDYIFANPPYCATNERGRVKNSVKNFEPSQALWGGNNGLFYIKPFLKEAKNYLKPKSVIYMEYDDTQKNEVERFIQREGYRDYQFYKDQYGLWRWVKVFQ